MDTNLTALYLAIETERTRLPQQAERGWLAERATGAHHKRLRAIFIRRRIGVAMISAGTLVHGTPPTPLILVGPTRTH